jgi:muramoyltetrapeptide carboxypeptidase
MFKFLKSLVLALSSHETKAIWALQGGAGATRLLPYLSRWSHSFTALPPYKILIGFSDITALHTFFIQKWKWPTLHAPTLKSAVTQSISKESLQSLKEVLFKERPAIDEINLLPLNESALHNSVIKAPLIGGNHSVLQYSIGTSWQLEARNKILFLEDINEEAYRIDVRLNHFLQAGLFEGVQAILFGDFTYTPEKGLEDYPKVEYVLKTFASHIPVPVFKMPGYGHGDVNKPLLMGSLAHLKTGKNPHLKISLT